jgi:hypothetical protein
MVRDAEKLDFERIRGERKSANAYGRKSSAADREPFS